MSLIIGSDWLYKNISLLLMKVLGYDAALRIFVQTRINARSTALKKRLILICPNFFFRMLS
jgi:hypothetical protein